METVNNTSSLCPSGSELYLFLKRIAVDNNVVVTFCNNGFTDFALNWFLTIQKLNINNYIVFALDQPSFSFLKQQNINTFLVDKENKLFTEESHNFGSVGFIAICNEKPWVVNQVLKAGFDVVWTDTDIVWLKVSFQIPSKKIFVRKFAKY